LAHPAALAQLPVLLGQDFAQRLPLPA
jgi:hypothetical protein